MKKQKSPLDAYTPSLLEVAKLYNHHVSNENISFDEYVKEKQKSIKEIIVNRKIVYLDTNAWKCVSDFIRKKTL